MSKRMKYDNSSSIPNLRCLPNDQYQIGWICALSIESAAAVAVMDQEHGIIRDKDIRDPNCYYAGVIHGHNVVVACAPDGDYSSSAVAVVATHMQRTFPNINIGLSVGIGGGLPAATRASQSDLRLGDVVVSSGKGTSSGVIQYDLGQRKQVFRGDPGQNDSYEFLQTGLLNRPPWVLRAALSSLRAQHLLNRSKISNILDTVYSNVKLQSKFKRPGPEHDQLFRRTCIHQTPLDARWACSSCDRCQVVSRQSKPRLLPKVFYGTVLSGNVFVEDAEFRDELAERYAPENPFCIEMQAAGLMNFFPCMVIRGISNYADSHNNDVWKSYAALTAAAFAKDLLSYVPLDKIKQEVRFR